MSGITVIIATYERAGLLRAALEALAVQHDPGVPVAVIVADNGSKDDTRAVFDDVARTRPDFQWKYVYEARPGKSYAVNSALPHAPGTWLAFTDDDVRPEPGWLAAIVEAFTRSDADFVVGRILAQWESEPPRWLTPALYGVLGIPDNGPTRRKVGLNRNEHIMAIGTNMAVRRTAVLRIGGLRPDLGKMRGTLRTGEDHDFYLRLLHAGCQGVYLPEARVRHLVPAARMDRGYFRRWYYQNGRNVAMVEAAYPPRTAMLFGVPRYMWRQAAVDAAGIVGDTVRLDTTSRFAHVVSLLWFAGYLRERWLAGRPAPRPAAVSPAPGAADENSGVHA